MHQEGPPTPAHAYQAFFGPAIFGPLAEQVVACAPPRAGDRVVDVACGTGILTRRLAALAGPGGTVVGVDLNPMMIEVAGGVGAPGGAPVEWRQGDGSALDLPDRSFDAAYCQQGLQFFPDRAAGAAELRRVVVDGGRAVVACWQGVDRHPMFAALAEAEAPALRDAGVDVSPDELVAPFSLGDAGDLRRLLADAGFGQVDVGEVSIEARFPEPERFVERMEFAYAAVVPAFADDPPAFRAYLDAIRDATRPVVERYTSGDHVVFPMHANVAVAW